MLLSVAAWTCSACMEAPRCRKARANAAQSVVVCTTFRFGLGAGMVNPVMLTHATSEKLDLCGALCYGCCECFVIAASRSTASILAAFGCRMLRFAGVFRQRC